MIIIVLLSLVSADPVITLRGGGGGGCGATLGNESRVRGHIFRFLYKLVAQDGDCWPASEKVSQRGAGTITGLRLTSTDCPKLPSPPSDQRGAVHKMELVALCSNDQEVRTSPASSETIYK